MKIAKYPYPVSCLTVIVAFVAFVAILFGV